MANYSNLQFNSDYKTKLLTLDGILFNHVQYRDSGHKNLLGRKTWDTTNASGTLTDDNYAVNAVDINWNGAQVNSNVTITTTGELLSWIKNLFESCATPEQINEAIQNLVGAAPETLDTLKEIADKLGEDDTQLGQLIAALESKANTEDVYTKNEIDTLLGEVETIKGDQGEQGPQGATGDQGVQGATGAQGEQGPQGEKGDQGVQGATGAKGEQGPQGTKGDQGVQGPQGTKGDQGVQGPQGEKGDTGTFDSSELESYATKVYVDSQVASIR